MKKVALILCLLAATTSAFPQQFIGCRTDSGWVETPMLRTTFHIDHGELRHSDFQTVRYQVSVASLGYHEVYVNDTKVGDYVMQPAVSQLDKRALEVTYDITNLVHEGDNELMLWIGQGWGRIYGTPAVAKAVVEKSVSDGECGLIYEILKTDTTWEASPSPYGTISIEIQNSQFTITIPAGTTATLFPGAPNQRELPSGTHRIEL